MVLSFVIRWYKRNRTTKCIKRLQKRSIDDNLRLVVGANKTRSCACNLKYIVLTCFFTSDSVFFFTFSKKWVGQEMGNETFYGDGLSDLIIVLP